MSGYFNDWPERRFDWNLEVFKPGVTGTDLRIIREEFQRAELTYSTDDSTRAYYKTNPYIILTFEKSSLGRHELSHMVLHP